MLGRDALIGATIFAVIECPDGNEAQGHYAIITSQGNAEIIGKLAITPPQETHAKPKRRATGGTF